MIFAPVPNDALPIGDAIYSSFRYIADDSVSQVTVAPFPTVNLRLRPALFPLASNFTVEGPQETNVAVYFSVTVASSARKLPLSCIKSAYT